MICKNCGYEASDDGVYCPKCGKRLDGKIACPKCKKLINNDSLFCTYCGMKIGDENVCQSCGTKYKGSFCPKCGTNSSRILEVPTEKNNDSIFAKIERFASPSLILCSLLVLFICSFFIGINVSANASSLGFSNFLISSSSIFGYISNATDSLDALSSYTETGIISSIYTFNIAVLIINLVITCATFIIGAIIYAVNIGKQKRVKIEVLGLISLVSFIVCTCCFFTSSAMSLNYTTSLQKAKITTSLSSSGNAGLIVATIVWVCVAALRRIKNFKNQEISSFILKTSLACVVAVLAIITLALLTNKTFNFSLTEKESGTTLTSNKMSFTSSPCFILILLWAYMQEEAISGGTIAGAYAVWIMQVVAIILLSVIIAVAIKFLISEKSKSGKSLIVLSVIAAIFVLAYTVVAAVISDSILAMFASEFSSGKITIGAPVVSTALSILILVISFIFVLTRDEKRENEEEFF